MREARGPEWTDWLHERGMPGADRASTRARSSCTCATAARCAAAVVCGADDVDEALRAVREQPSMSGAALAGARLDRRAVRRTARTASSRVAVVDYGAKRSILRRLAGAGAAVTVFPHDVDADTLAGFDGVLLSNGPGDPEPLAAEVAIVRELLGRVPVLGICLGHQLLALATGLETFKLPFGHRGANHPVLERATGRVLVTSQNHGFAVERRARTAPPRTSRSTTAPSRALAYPELRARSVQFHPEAGPGPHDAWPLLADWVEEVRLAAA